MHGLSVILGFILGILTDTFKQIAVFIFSRKNIELSYIDDAYELSYTMVDFFERKSIEINAALVFLKQNVHLPIENKTIHNPLPKLLKILDLHLNLNNEEKEIIKRIKQLEDDYKIPMIGIFLALKEPHEKEKYISQTLETSGSLLEEAKILRDDILHILKTESQKIKNTNTISKFKSYCLQLCSNYHDHQISPLTSESTKTTPPSITD